MDKETRNRIQRATQTARALLEHEYAEQLEGIFDIRLDGTIAAETGEHLDDAQRVLRTKLVTAVEHQRATGMTKADAVAAYLREAAFTTLNRFSALRMLEARELVQECISRGDQSTGFREFTGLAAGLVQLPDHGYRLYIESLFDEIGCEVSVLFDRRDPASLLWPRRQALLDLLDILNQTELATVWGEDETIGWVYQYFNGDDERKQMRAESQTPRNSRELAVRNQFFTPRYVVQFLVDNTLGRIWYEMRHGETRLRDLGYLVRPLNEVFLAKEDSPAAEANDSYKQLSQEELLQRPVNVPFRPKKDPRDLRVLDPACGSGHFLLYAFDLLLAIYEEAWADKASPASEVSGLSLRDDYPELNALRAAAPGLILRHNLHGIDIDARCAQIAALALWMRAQRAYNNLGIDRDVRPAIEKTSIAVAEPMPGEKELRKEFVGGLDERLGRLLEHVFETMDLAGEAGSLLTIEKEIDRAIRAAYGETGVLFRESDQERWQQAEAQLLAALAHYAQAAEMKKAYRRRLFADDAARGLAFLDACRRRYDAVLMNPPFGLAPKRVFAQQRKDAPDCYVEMYAQFINRGMSLLTAEGVLGAVSSRSFLMISRLERYRTRLVVPHIAYIADLGAGVMDDAFVEAAAYVLSMKAGSILWGVDLRGCGNPAQELLQQTRAAFTNSGQSVLVLRGELETLPGRKVLYNLPASVRALLRSSSVLEPDVATVRQGMGTFDDFRFLRLRWEVRGEHIKRNAWEPLAKGGAFSFYYSDIHLLLNWWRDGAELSAVNIAHNGQDAQVRQASDYWRRPGLTYSKRSQKGFSARVLPAGCIIAGKGPAVLSLSQASSAFLLGWVNSRLIRWLIEIQANDHEYNTGILKRLPWVWPRAGEQDVFRVLIEDTERGVAELATIHASVETNSWFADIPHADSIGAGYRRWQEGREEARREVQQLMSRWDKAVDELYGVDSSDLHNDVEPPKESGGNADEDTPNADESSAAVDEYAKAVLGIALGCALGHWRRPTAGAVACSPDPFGGLPSRPPAARGSLEESGQGRAPDCAILVDDEGAASDVCTTVKQVVSEMFRDDDGAARLCEHATGSRDVRAWLRLHAFDQHLKRFSGSRRKAPIYWQISTATTGYSAWFSYHALTKDTFYRLLNDFVTPRLEHEQRQLTSLTQQVGLNTAASQRKEVDEQERLVTELRAFRDEISRVAPLWNPNTNDGVVINFAPLWRLVPHHRTWQKECKAAWEKLGKGEYDWADLAMHLWPERVVPKCAQDRSLAIAHDLEGVFWYRDSRGSWQPRKVAQADIDQLIKKRTSAAVKDALKSLLEAPAPVTGRMSKTKAPRAKGARRKTLSTQPPSATSSSLTRRSARAAPTAGANLLGKVKGAIAANGDGASKATVIEATGITTGQWNTAIKTLLADGSVTQTGERRGARYHLAGGNA